MGYGKASHQDHRVERRHNINVVLFVPCGAEVYHGKIVFRYKSGVFLDMQHTCFKLGRCKSYGAGVSICRN